MPMKPSWEPQTSQNTTIDWGKEKEEYQRRKEEYQRQKKERSEQADREYHDDLAKFNSLGIGIDEAKKRAESARLEKTVDAPSDMEPFMDPVELLAPGIASVGGKGLAKGAGMAGKGIAKLITAPGNIAGKAVGAVKRPAVKALDWAGGRLAGYTDEGVKTFKSLTPDESQFIKNVKSRPEEAVKTIRESARKSIGDDTSGMVGVTKSKKQELLDMLPDEKVKVNINDFKGTEVYDDIFKHAKDTKQYTEIESPGYLDEFGGWKVDPPEIKINDTVDLSYKDIQRLKEKAQDAAKYSNKVVLDPMEYAAKQKANAAAGRQFRSTIEQAVPEAAGLNKEIQKAGLYTKALKRKSEGINPENILSPSLGKRAMRAEIDAMAPSGNLGRLGNVYDLAKQEIGTGQLPGAKSMVSELAGKGLLKASQALDSNVANKVGSVAKGAVNVGTAGAVGGGAILANEYANQKEPIIPTEEEKAAYRAQKERIIPTAEEKAAYRAFMQSQRGLQR